MDLLFQLTESELSEQQVMFTGKGIDDRITSYLFFVIELTAENYSRTALSQITREVNKVFQIPVMVLFKYGAALTLAIIDRQPHQRDEAKDVLRKVTLIKDIRLQNTHRAHLEILADLSLPKLSANQISSWNPYAQNAKADWFDAEWMFGIEKGFDIVIGNPPYIFVTEFSKQEKSYFSTKYPTYSYRFDIHGLFIELAFTAILSKNGFISLIIPHTLLNNDSFELLRKFLLDKSSLTSIVDLGGDVFESAKNETMIFFAENRKPTPQSSCYVVKSNTLST